MLFVGVTLSPKLTYCTYNIFKMYIFIGRWRGWKKTRMTTQNRQKSNAKIKKNKKKIKKMYIYRYTVFFLLFDICYNINTSYTLASIAFVHFSLMFGSRERGIRGSMFICIQTRICWIMQTERYMATRLMLNFYLETINSAEAGCICIHFWWYLFHITH